MYTSQHTQELPSLIFLGDRSTLSAGDLSRGIGACRRIVTPGGRAFQTGGA